MLNPLLFRFPEVTESEVISESSRMPRILITFLVFSALQVSPSFGQDINAFGMPALTSAISANGETTYSLSLQILLLMTALTVLPSLVLGMTAFTRIIIVLSILRQALGTQQTPPNQVLIAIALFLSFYIMSPIFEVLYVETINPYLDGNLSAETAMSRIIDFKRIYGF